MTAREGFVVWLTGLSGAGKSTLAAALSRELSARGLHVEVLDGDEVRRALWPELGFEKEDRDANVARIAWVARRLCRSGAAVLVAAISPYREARKAARTGVARFAEVHCACPLEVLAARDPKGLYARARRGELPRFTGVSDPYEEPESPELRLDTSTEHVDASLGRLLDFLQRSGWLPRDA